MYKAILMMLLAVVSSSAMAEWVYVTATGTKAEAEAFTAYADPATIRKTGNRVKMWSLYDYKMVQEPGVISAKQKNEYNCKKKQSRQLFLSAYSGHMTDGETVLIHNEPDDHWKRAPLGSVLEAVLEFACGWHPKLPPRNFPSMTVAKAIQGVDGHYSSFTR